MPNDANTCGVPEPHRCRGRFCQLLPSVRRRSLSHGSCPCPSRIWDEDALAARRASFQRLHNGTPLFGPTKQPYDLLELARTSLVGIPPTYCPDIRNGTIFSTRTALSVGHAPGTKDEPIGYRPAS